ncbi:MAG: GGDEF domain-containing protein, partial [Clostridia bacterium]|nr:GGDEF domain-containing protein [Clostridia bacterium]
GYWLVKRHRIKGKTRIRALNNLSGSFHAMEEAHKSIKCLTECIRLLKKDFGEDYTDLVMYSLNLAGCYKDVGELDRAKETLESISNILEKVEFKPLVCDYYLRSAVVAYRRKDADAGNGFMDAAFSIFPENVYPLPLYDDLCEVACMISKNKDRERSKKTFDLMTVYAEKNPGTLEQLFATRVMANYYKNFGEYELATELFSKYEELNERQMRELKEMQMKLHNTSMKTEAEIRKLKRIMRENEEIVSLEPMTKLLNRSALLKLSTEFLESAAKKKQKVGAIFIDIDYFKQCNDTYGHAKGDEIIKEVAHICRKYETQDIRFARYGGDEFFGITRGLPDEAVCDVARRICRAFQSADISDVKSPSGGRLTLSVGVVNVSITDRTDSILEIANYADKALYHAKNSGKNAIYALNYNKTDKKEREASFVKIDF